MLLNRNFVAVSLLWLSGCISTPTWASDVCPVQDHQPMQSVEIYDAHRSVTVRCKYADGRSADVKLGKRIERCDYRFDRSKALALRCE